MLLYEDIVVGAVMTYGRYEITREEIIAFASRYDPQEFHLSDKAAAEGPFGKLAASGWMTASIAMRIMVDHWNENGTTSAGGAGVEQLNWLRPVWPGDVLSVRQTILEKRRSRSRPDLGIVRHRIEALDADGEPVMSMISTGLANVRDPEGMD